MKVEKLSSDGGFGRTNPDRNLFALLNLKYRLNIEITTGLKHSRGSTINAARNWGYKGPQRKASALVWVEQRLEEYEQDLQEVKNSVVQELDKEDE